MEGGGQRGPQMATSHFYLYVAIYESQLYEYETWDNRTPYLNPQSLTDSTELNRLIESLNFISSMLREYDWFETISTFYAVL